MRQILERISLPAARVSLALFVAWGAVEEMTAPLFAQFHLPPSAAEERGPPPHYWIRRSYKQRGWPLVYYVRTSPPTDNPLLRNEDNPFALACDIAFVALLMLASLNLFRGCGFRFGVADLLGATTALGATMAFHIWAWDHDLDWSKIAVDLGVFSTTVMVMGWMRKIAPRSLRLAARLSWKQVGRHNS
jgi:hypothetical protein